MVKCLEAEPIRISEKDFVFVHICGLLGFDLIVRQLLQGQQNNPFKVCAEKKKAAGDLHMLLGACIF